MPATPIPRQPEISETEAKMRDLALKHVAREGYPAGEIALNRLIRVLQSALPKAPPPDGLRRSGRVPSDVYERAMEAAAATAAAGKGPVCPPGGPRALSAGNDRSGPEIGPQAATDDPRNHDVLRLLVDGLSNRQIGDRLNLTSGQVNHSVRVWLRASGQSTRLGAVAWAHRSGLADVGQVAL
jgi:hypothetical protein